MVQTLWPNDHNGSEPQFLCFRKEKSKLIKLLVSLILIHLLPSAETQKAEREASKYIIRGHISAPKFQTPPTTQRLGTEADPCISKLCILKMLSSPHPCQREWGFGFQQDWDSSVRAPSSKCSFFSVELEDEQPWAHQDGRHRRGWFATSQFMLQWGLSQRSSERAVENQRVWTQRMQTELHSIGTRRPFIQMLPALSWMKH